MTTLFTDGGMNKMTKGEGWGCVVDNNSQDIVPQYIHLCQDFNIKKVNLPVGERTVLTCKFDDLIQQNNGAELMAFLLALRIARENDTIQSICCDSELIVKWWSKGIYKIKDPWKIQLISECAQLRKILEDRGGKIIKIKGSENPADLGYHK